MKILTLILALLTSCNCQAEIGSTSHAQSSGGGLYKVTTLDGGTCTGKGSKGSPLNCTIATDNAIDTGVITFSVEEPITGRFRYTRSSGSFITDGFEVGMAVTFSGISNAGNNGTKVITAMKATGLTLHTSPVGMVVEAGTGDERAIGGGTIMGTGSAGAPFSASVPLQGSTFALFGDGSNNDLTLENAPGMYKTLAGSAWTAGASSVQTFAGDGYVQMTAFETSYHRMFGVSTADPNVDYASIEYGIHLNNGGSINIYESGVLSAALVTSYETGDVLSIHRVGTTITYKKNGATFYTSLIASTGTLMIDTSIYTQLGSLMSVYLNDNGTDEPVTWQNITGLSTVPGLYIQLSDMFFEDLTIEAGAWWYPYNFRTFVLGTLAIAGDYSLRGNPGTNGVAGSITVGDCLAAAGGVALPDNTMQLSFAGMASPTVSTTQPTCASGTCGQPNAFSPDHCAASATDLAGATSTGVGNNGASPAAGTCRGGGGGSGGGFVGTASAKGGSPQGLNPVLSGGGSMRAWPDVVQGGLYFVGQPRDAGGGGGGAGSCGRDTTAPTHQSPGGGGGGAGGGWMVVFAREIVLSGAGLMSVKGGLGGNGGSCGTHDGNAGGGGAGGGGGGGTAHIIFGTGTTPTVDVSGGAGGTGGTACAGGSNGGNGAAGSDGEAYIFKAGL